MSRSLAPTKIDTSLNREQVVKQLQKIAKEWQETAAEEGQSLVEIQSSVGLLLYNVTEALGLSYQEEEKILRYDLIAIKLTVGDPITIKG